MRTKKFITNTLFAALRYLVIFLTGIVLPKLYITNLGTEVNGLVGSLTAFITYFVLIESGFRSAATFALYKPVVQGDRETTNQILSNASSTLRKFSYLFMAFVIVFGVFASLFLKVEGVNPFLIFALTIILSLPTFITFFYSYKYTVLLTVHQEAYITEIGHTIERILSFVVVFVLITYLPLNPGLKLIITQSALLLITILYIFFVTSYVKKRYKYINFKVNYPKGLIKNQKDTFINAVVARINTSLVTVVATIIFSPTLTIVGILTVYGSIVFGISGIINIFRTGVSAGFGEIIAKEEPGVLKRAYTEFQTIFYFVVTVVNILIISLLPTFMNIYLGVVDGVDYVILGFAFLFPFSTYLSDLNVSQAMLLNAAGKYRERRGFNIASAIGAPILTLTFGYIGKEIGYGLEGIMIAMIIYALIRLLYMKTLVSNHVLKDKDTHVHSTKLVIFSTLIMFVITIPNYVYYAFIKLKVFNYYRWVIYALVLTLISVVLLAFTYIIIDKKVIKQILSRLKKT